MRLEPRDIWTQAMTGGLQVPFMGELRGFEMIHGVKPGCFLIPPWLHAIAQCCLGDVPRFAGVPLVPSTKVRGGIFAVRSPEVEMDFSDKDDEEVFALRAKRYLTPAVVEACFDENGQVNETPG